jgi:hypothetical protein
MPGNYKSPFKLPSDQDQTCTNPAAIRSYNLNHAQQDNCPVHSDNFHGPWQRWADAREAYATYLATGNDEYDQQQLAHQLNFILGQVTATNPPNNIPTRGPSRKSPARRLAISITSHHLAYPIFAILSFFFLFLFVWS